MIILLQWPRRHIVDYLLKPHPKEHAYPHILLGTDPQSGWVDRKLNLNYEKLGRGSSGSLKECHCHTKTQFSLFVWAFFFKSERCQTMQGQCYLPKQQGDCAVNQEHGGLQGRTAHWCCVGGQSTATAIGLQSLVFSTSKWKVPSQKNMPRLCFGRNSCFIPKESLGIS